MPKQVSDVGLFGWNEPTWVAISAIVTAIAALATTGMVILTRSLANKTSQVANETAELARETKELAASSIMEMQQAERHHLDSLTPLVFVSIKASMRRVANTDTMQISYEGIILNAGPGPATDVDVFIAPSSLVPRKHPIGMIAASSSNPFERSTNYGANTATPISPPFTLFIRYKDIFGRLGGTYQRSHSGLAEHCTVEQLIRPGTEDVTEEKFKEIMQGRGFSGNEDLA